MAVFSYKQLLAKFGDDPHPRARICRELRENRLLRICEGWYIDEEPITSLVVANIVLAPSYISFAYALFEYDLIPEGVFHPSAAICNNRKFNKTLSSKNFTCNYTSIPERVFHCGLELHREPFGQKYLIASREKAVCDQLYVSYPSYSVERLESLLFDNLRFERIDFFNLDLRYMANLAPMYGNLNGYYLQKYLAKYITDVYCLPDSEINYFKNMLVEKTASRMEIEVEHKVRQNIQKIVLLALSKTDFFEHASFYGASALSLFYGLRRYSTNLDFELLHSDDADSMEKLLPSYADEIRNTFIQHGLNAEVELETRTIWRRSYLNMSSVRQVTIKVKKRLAYAHFEAESELVRRTHWNANLQTAILVETIPNDYIVSVIKTHEKDPRFTIRVHDLPTLCAGKLAALLFRIPAEAPNGRDLFDYLFLLKNCSKLNSSYLRNEIFIPDIGHYKSADEITKEAVYHMLQYKLFTIVYHEAKKDAEQYVHDPDVVSCWDRGYFSNISKEYKISAYIDDMS